MRLVAGSKLLRRFVARIIGVGIRPKRVHLAAAALQKL
jgi:hypothetical protein